jgi:hypothetical protein
MGLHLIYHGENPLVIRDLMRGNFTVGGNFAPWPLNHGVTLLTVARPLPNPPLKGDWIGNSITASPAAISTSFFPCSPQSSSLAMAASHPHLFQQSVTNESEIRKLIVSYFLPGREVLQWRPAASEDIPTSNTNEIVVFASFFQPTRIWTPSL